MSNLKPPTDIIEAARQIYEWAELNGHTEYEIHGICSRKRVLALEREVALLMGRLQQLQNKVRVDAATAALQGLNASLSGTNEWPDAQDRARMVCEARFQADALIAELNKTTK